ncbi:MAG: hypothetical protein WA996_23670, partial [Candidatus Promineifilaceae bacterium]
MINTTVDYIRNVDTFAAINYLCKQDDPFSITSSFNDVVGHLYWEDKDLAGVVAMGRAGIQYGLAASAEAESINPKAVREICLKVQALAFNVASYTWPGWEEAGIEPNPTDVALGYDAAKVGVRLVEEMEAEPIKFRRAFWMLGAHQLAAGKSARAEQSFSLSARYADESSAVPESLLARTFGILARAQSDPAATNLVKEMEGIKAGLAEEEHGADFI